MPKDRNAPAPWALRALIEKIVTASETGRRKSHAQEEKAPPTLDHAGTSKSGYSVGETQIDLASHPERAEELKRFLGGQGMFTKEETEAIAAGLAKKGDKAAIPDSLKASIDRALNTPAGRKMIDGWDKAQFDQIERWVGDVRDAARANERYGADEAFAEYVEGPEFAALVADNVNQFGEPDQLKKWVSGNRATVGDQPVRLEDKPLSAKTFAEYESHYDWVRRGDGGKTDAGLNDIARRREGVFDTLAREGLLDPTTARQRREAVRGNYENGRKAAMGSGAFDRLDRLGLRPDPATPSDPSGVGFSGSASSPADASPQAPAPAPAAGKAAAGGAGDSLSGLASGVGDAIGVGLGMLSQAASFASQFAEAAKAATAKDPTLVPLSKAAHELSDPEVKAMMAADAFWKPGHPRYRALHEKVTGFFEHYYPNRSRFDEFGKTIEPKPIRPVPLAPRPSAGPDPIGLAIRLGGLLDRHPGDDPADGVRGLQDILNGEAERHGYWPALKVDGVFGPKTATRLAELAPEVGTRRLEEALILHLGNARGRS